MGKNGFLNWGALPVPHENVIPMEVDRCIPQLLLCHLLEMVDKPSKL